MAKVGKRYDPLLAALVVRIRIEGEKKHSTIYYCIGCDDKWCNNSSGRALSHATSCKVLARDFPDVYAEAEKCGSNTSLEGVLGGQSKAPAVRGTKRKAADISNGRESGSVPILAQAAITDTFGPKRLTATQQAVINYYLLQLIICSSLAYSLLDNGFLFDFCAAL